MQFDKIKIKNLGNGEVDITIFGIRKHRFKIVFGVNDEQCVQCFNYRREPNGCDFCQMNGKKIAEPEILSIKYAENWYDPDDQNFDKLGNIFPLLQIICKLNACKLTK